ncbi:MAG: hypothetical protein IIB44_12840 [Candidatus Marinimicrobia bacterium]|nr:hypothetical protein [Candidatus Neomarinimicrobiota bacterium]
MPIDRILLFDEHGTPTFRDDRESDYFVGVGVSSNLVYWDRIINECRSLFGLDNSRPVKNRNLGLSRINTISSLLLTLPITWVVIVLDLSNEDLIRVINLYNEYGNELRRHHRGIRGRPVAQILYQQIINHVIFESIQRDIELNPIDTNFNIYIDNWSIPINDRTTMIDLMRSSMEARTNEITTSYFPNASVTINNYELLIEDSHKKRFIDIITSVASRAFFPESDERYSSQVDTIITSNQSIFYEDITSTTTEFLIDFMNRTARGEIE